MPNHSHTRMGDQTHVLLDIRPDYQPSLITVEVKMLKYVKSTSSALTFDCSNLKRYFDLVLSPEGSGFNAAQSAF